tara:strand:- start:845 stop:1483 length:639 start_codon:yes stop_codon:yes gene_type:complete
MAITINGNGTITGYTPATVADGGITASKLAAGVGGKVLQVVSTSDANSILQGQVTVPTTNGSSTNVVELPNISISITPSATTSKIILSVNLFGEGNANDENFIINIKRAISGGSDTYIPALMDAVVGGARPSCLGTFVPGYHGSDNETTPAIFNYSNLLDSPSTTSAITYSVVLRCTASSNKTWDYNRTTNTENAYNRERGKSIITAIEVAA